MIDVLSMIANSPEGQRPVADVIADAWAARARRVPLALRRKIETTQQLQEELSE